MKLRHEIEAEVRRLSAQRDALNGAIQALEWSLAAPPACQDFSPARDRPGIRKQH